MKIVLPLYKPGVEVYYRDGWYKVDHVVISRYDIYLFLEGISLRVNADDVYLEPTIIDIPD